MYCSTDLEKSSSYFGVKCKLLVTMHIGLDTSRLSVQTRTGTEHYTWELLHALGQIDWHNRYTLYARAYPPALPPLPPNFLLRTIPWPRVWTHIRLSAEMLVRAPDVLFVPAHVVPLVHPRRTIVTIHDLGYEHFPTAHPAQQRWYLRLSTRWSAHQAAHIIADSEATKHDLVQLYGIDPRKITVVYLGVSPRFGPVDDLQVLQTAWTRYGIQPSYVIFVGTVQPRKNLGRLIEAFAQAGLGDVQLVIVGKRGWLTEGIEALAARLGIAHRVRFTGYVDDADLPALLSGARALALPSLYEGFGLTALEAMRCGTPVLAARTSSLPEVVGNAGVLVDPLDVNDIARGLRQIVQDNELHAELRERGLQRGESWTWERCAQQTLQVIRGVMAA